MNVIYEKNVFNNAKKVTWDDLLEKISVEYDKNTGITVLSPLTLTAISPIIESKKSPTIVCHNSYLPGTLLNAFNEVSTNKKVRDMHIYTSFSKNADTFVRHKDDNDVLIVQAIGKTSYLFDDGKEYTLSPGDSIFIPKGVYHTPKILEPRVTLSFGI
jgi:hypothetical protein